MTHALLQIRADQGWFHHHKSNLALNLIITECFKIPCLVLTHTTDVHIDS